MLLIAELMADPGFRRVLRENHERLMQMRAARRDEIKPPNKEIKEKTR